MRKIVFISCLLLLLPLANAQTMLTGQVVAREQVDTARQTAFEHAEKKKNLSNEAQLDPDMVTNIRARLNQTCLKDRRIMPFSNGNYAVGFFGQTVAHYYRADGTLVGVEFFSKPIESVSWRQAHPEDYPIQSFTYAYPSGHLSGVIQHQALEEDYAFNPTGQLRFYCLGLECHNVMTGQVTHRDIVEPCSGAQVITDHY